MSNEPYVDNLHQIISKNGKEVQPGSSDLAKKFLQKVVKIIMRRKKNGIDVPTLSEKTGLNARKIRNIVSRALKNGKIRRIGRGLYCSR